MPPVTKARGQVVGGVANLTKNLVGAGIVSLPAAMLHGSTVPGSLALAVVGLLCGSTFVLIAFLCQQLGCVTYRDMGLVAFGPRVATAIDLGIVLNGVGACVSYVILIGDSLQKSGQAIFNYTGSRQLPMWICTMLLMLPLSHARNLWPLRYTSMLGLAIIGLVWCYVMGDCLRHPAASAHHLMEEAFRLDMGIFSTIAISTGAFKAHYNAPKFYQESGSDLGVHTRVVVYSYTISFLMFLGFALAGVGIFGDDVLGNLLRNYPSEGNPVMVYIWLGWAFSIAFTYPLVFSPSRDSLVRATPALRRWSESHPTTTHVAVTTSLVVAITGMACCVEDVSLVTGLSGATIGAALCWIIPAAVYLRAAGGSRSDAGKPAGTAPLAEGLLTRGQPGFPGSTSLKVYSIAMIVFGTVSMVIGGLHTFMEL